MLITQGLLDAIFTNFNLRFQTAFDTAPNWYQQLATEVPSSTLTETYAWMEKLPRMRKWLGEREVKNIAALGYSLTNEDYEATIGVPRNVIADARVGVFNSHVDDLARQAKKWPDDLIVAAMQSTTNLAWDGQYFWDSDHAVDYNDASKGTYANLYTSKPLNAANFNTVRYSMRLLNGSDGKPLGIRPNLLIVPPQLEQTARQIVQMDYVAPGTALGMNAANVMQQNPLKGTAELLVIDELGNEADTWYLMDTTKAIKPFIFQLREAVHLEALTNMTDENVFWRKEYIYGVAARGCAGYTLPFLAARVTA